MQIYYSKKEAITSLLVEVGFEYKILRLRKTWSNSPLIGNQLTNQHTFKFYSKSCLQLMVERDPAVYGTFLGLLRPSFSADNRSLFSFFHGFKC